MSALLTSSMCAPKLMNLKKPRPLRQSSQDPSGNMENVPRPETKAVKAGEVLPGGVGRPILKSTTVNAAASATTSAGSLSSLSSMAGPGSQSAKTLPASEPMAQAQPEAPLTQQTSNVVTGQSRLQSYTALVNSGKASLGAPPGFKESNIVSHSSSLWQRVSAAAAEAAADVQRKSQNRVDRDLRIVMVKEDEGPRPEPGAEVKAERNAPGAGEVKKPGALSKLSKEDLEAQYLRAKSVVLRYRRNQAKTGSEGGLKEGLSSKPSQSAPPSDRDPRALSPPSNKAGEDAAITTRNGFQMPRKLYMDREGNPPNVRLPTSVPKTASKRASGGDGTAQWAEGGSVSLQRKQRIPGQSSRHELSTAIRKMAAENVGAEKEAWPDSVEHASTLDQSRPMEEGSSMMHGSALASSTPLHCSREGMKGGGDGPALTSISFEEDSGIGDSGKNAFAGQSLLAGSHLVSSKGSPEEYFSAVITFENDESLVITSTSHKKVVMACNLVASEMYGTVVEIDSCGKKLPASLPSPKSPKIYPGQNKLAMSENKYSVDNPAMPCGPGSRDVAAPLPGKRISYDKRTLLQFSTAPASKRRPKNYDFLLTVYPEIFPEKIYSFFSPEDLKETRYFV